LERKRLAFLSEQHTDFIFLGRWGGARLSRCNDRLALSLALLRSPNRERANDSYSVWCVRTESSWFVHVLVNVGMTLNLMPITGNPLPFFSYGSFLLASWFGGILMAFPEKAAEGVVAPRY